MKIVYVSGTRADYGLMKGTLEKLRDKVDLTILCTGMHLMETFGYTVKDVVADGFNVQKLASHIMGMTIPICLCSLVLV